MKYVCVAGVMRMFKYICTKLFNSIKEIEENLLPKIGKIVQEAYLDQLGLV